MKKNSLKKTGIIYNSDIKEAYNLANIINEKIEDSLVFSIDNLSADINLAMVIGGDGTFLRAARYYCHYSIPIIGFNVGRLGFLAQANPKELNSVIEKLKNEDYSIENRLMLSYNNNNALNDIVIKGKNPTRTSTLNLFINDKLLCSYVADGLIISTPTGSTAYSLSAGGPIIAPTLECLTIVPICPHTLNTRPIVVLADEKITIKNQENENLNVVLDGQVNCEADCEVTIEKNKNYAKLLILNKQKDKFYDILKEKLYWSTPIKK